MARYFTIAEMTRSETAERRNMLNVITDERARNNMTRLMDALDKVRIAFGAPILINSGYRSEELNRAIGGARKSMHMVGAAADIRVKGMPPMDIWNLWMAVYNAWTEETLNRVIMEEDEDVLWIHVEIYDRRNPQTRGVWTNHSGAMTEMTNSTKREIYLNWTEAKI